MCEKYPLLTVAASNLLTLAVYSIGAIIVYRLNAVALAAYLIYIVWLELRLIRGHCVNCYYFGKICFTGKGKLSSLFFKKGDPQKFARMQITWKSMIPDMLVLLVPMMVGIFLLFKTFDWALLAMIVLLFLLATTGTGFVRGTLACKYCKQREIGCPADNLFNKKNTGAEGANV